MLPTYFSFPPIPITPIDPFARPDHSTYNRAAPCLAFSLVNRSFSTPSRESASSTCYSTNLPLQAAAQDDTYRACTLSPPISLCAALKPQPSTHLLDFLTHDTLRASLQVVYPFLLLFSLLRLGLHSIAHHRSLTKGLRGAHGFPTERSIPKSSTTPVLPPSPFQISGVLFLNFSKAKVNPIAILPPRTYTAEFSTPAAPTPPFLIKKRTQPHTDRTPPAHTGRLQLFPYVSLSCEDPIRSSMNDPRTVPAFHGSLQLASKRDTQFPSPILKLITTSFRISRALVPSPSARGNFVPFNHAYLRSLIESTH